MHSACKIEQCSAEVLSENQSSRSQEMLVIIHCMMHDACLLMHDATTLLGHVNHMTQYQMSRCHVCMHGPTKVLPVWLMLGNVFMDQCHCYYDTLY